MATYVLPQVQVFQDFIEAPASAVATLNACIVGPQFNLFRYDDADEKPGIKVSNDYDPDDETCFGWPGRVAGGVVDPDYTKVFFENALLQYFHDPAGDSSPVNWVAPGKNRIRASQQIFKTANGYTRSAGLLRDVKVGDAVQLIASACAEPVTFESTVIALIADTIAAIVDAATPDVGNQTTLVAGVTDAQTGGDTNHVLVQSTDGTAYNGLAQGNPVETYTVEVIGGSSGGDATTAILKVTSASGNDNVPVLTPSAFGSPTPVGTRGLEVTFNNNGTESSGTPADLDDFLLGQKWQFTVTQAFTPSVGASGGAYAGIQDTTYIVTVSLGGKFADATLPQITVSTTTGVDVSGPTNVTGSGDAIPIGTQGVHITFTGAALDKGDRYYIPVVAEAPGAVRTLALATNLPDALRGECSSSSSSSAGPAPDLDLTLYIKKNLEVTEDRVGEAPLVNWIQSPTEICLEAGIEAFDAEWQSGGILYPLPVKGGAIYVQHRDLVGTNCNTVGEATDVSGVPDALGVVHPDNPLAFGVFKALENSNGVAVKYLNVCSTTMPLDLEDWLAAIEVLVGRDDVYSLVPLTTQRDVLDAFVAHAESESTPVNGRWRIAWLNMLAQPVLDIYSSLANDEPILATITDDPDTSGVQNTLVQATGAKFLTAGVRSGDTLRYNYTTDGFGNDSYSESQIDQVLNDESLRLLSGPTAPVNVPSKVEVWRTLTKTELAEELATYPGLYSSRRAYLVWPDVVGNAGLTFAGYFLCAALAGLRSGVLPQQGLTNVEILGFDDLSRTGEFFSANQLNIMAGSGYWIVIQDPNTGVVYTRQELSTGNQLDLNTKEQMITTNLDSISYTFLNRLKIYIGRGNVTPTMINLLRGVIQGVITELSNTILIDRLGPQIITGIITQLAPHPTLRDRVICYVSLDLPEPLNNIDLHLIV